MDESIKECEALYLLEPHKVQFDKRTVPNLGPKDILVKMITASICETDFKIYLGSIKTKKTPIILGHEGFGEVIDKGNKVRYVDVGDYVLIDPNIVDNTCFLCRIGKSNLCLYGGLMGRDDDGLFSEYLVIEETKVYKLPKTINHTTAPLLQPLSTAIHAQNIIEIKPGDKVVILGGGVMGLMHLQLAKLRGTQTTVVELNPIRAKNAKRLGADVVLEQDVGTVVDKVKEIFGGGADVVIECIGIPKAVEAAIKMVRPGGTILLFGISTESARLDLYQMYFYEVKLQASRSSTPKDFIEAIELVASGRIDLMPYVSKTIDFRKLPEAFEELKQEKDKVIRYIATFSGIH